MCLSGWHTFSGPLGWELGRHPWPCWRASSEACDPASPCSNTTGGFHLIGPWTRTHGPSCSREAGYPTCRCTGSSFSNTHGSSSSSPPTSTSAPLSSLWGPLGWNSPWSDGPRRASSRWLGSAFLGWSSCLYGTHARAEMMWRWRLWGHLVPSENAVDDCVYVGAGAPAARLVPAMWLRVPTSFRHLGGRGERGVGVLCWRE